MTGALRRARAARARRAAGDGGYTLVELVVAMGVFAAVLAVFMSALLLMFRDTNRVQTVGRNSDGLRKAFMTLDRQVRYADGVNVPGPAVPGGRTFYAEFRTPQDGAIVAQCYQWRYDATAGTLAWRTWPAAGSAGSVVWRQVASGLAAGPGVANPFTMRPAVLVGGAQATASPDLTSVVHQRLDVAVNSGRGAGGTGEQLTTTFVAVNTDVNSPGNLSVGASGAASDNPVCSPSTSRT